MRKLLQNVFLTGVLFTCFMLSQTPVTAQVKYDWGNPNIPYIDQRGFSIGFNLGFTDLWGDVGTKSIMDHYLNDMYLDKPLDNMRMMGGLFVRYTHVPGISFRAGVNYGALYATDEWNGKKAGEATSIEDDAYQRYVRNLDVYTNIWEGSLLFELSPFQLFNWEFGRTVRWRLQPYLLAGFSGVHYNPQGSFVDLEAGTKNRVDLQPFHTEGQNFNAPGHDIFPDNYNLWTFAGIGGVGMRFNIGRSFGLGLEYQLRYTFTDYLDDVSGKYIDPMFFDLAFLNEHGKNKRAYKMADRSNEIIPGLHHKPDEFRGNPNDKDMFSSVSLMFYWKIDKRVLRWWE